MSQIILSIATEPVTTAQALQAVFADLGENTLRSYGNALEDFAAAIGVATKEEAARTLLSLDQGNANLLASKYRVHLMNRTPALAAATVKTRLGALAGIVKRVRRLGIVNWKLDVEGVAVTPMRDTRGPGMKSIDDMRSFLGKEDTPLSSRNLAIVELLFNPALRRAEVGRLDYEHIDFENSRILVRGKGRHDEEFITVPSTTLNAIRRWLQHRGHQPGPLFTNLDPVYARQRLGDHGIYKAIGVIGTRACGRRARPHGLRHTAITELLRLTNGNVQAVQKFSRHRSISTVLLYDDNREDEGGRLANLLSGSGRL